MATDQSRCFFFIKALHPRDPPVLKTLRRVSIGTGTKFGTDVAKRHGLRSACFSRKRRQENGTDTDKLRRWQNSTDSSAISFLVRKGPLDCSSLENKHKD